MISVQGISKRYGKKQVLTEVSFDAKPGEKIAIMGKNGCGKTTLLQILSGVISPNAGELCYFGNQPLKQKNVFAQTCGYVPQGNPLMEELSVRDNLLLWGGREAVKDARLRQMFDLDEILDAPIYKLSGGMKRRVSIACALAKWPAVVFMDEPTASLDLYYKDIIYQWMDEYTKMDGILIVATHEEQEIMQSDRCLLLRNGVLEEISLEDKSTSFIYEAIRGGNENGYEF